MNNDFNHKLEEVEKGLEEIHNKLTECAIKMAYLRGLLIGLNNKST